MEQTAQPEIPVRGRQIPRTWRGQSSMHFIILDSETDFEGWRKAARGLVLHHVPPSEVKWSVHGNGPELFEPSATTLPLETSRHFQRTGQIRRTGAVGHPAPRPQALCDPLSPVVAAAK